VNEKQRLVEVRDQFALKNASDDTLKKILPSYRQAINDIRMQLEFLPEGKLERELWLKTQLKTIELQFKQVADRIDQVLPPAQAEQFMRALDNAKEFLEAAEIRPPSPDIGLINAVPAPELPAGEFLSPGITRQQIEAASRTGGFSTFTLDDQQITLSEVLPKWQKAQAANLEKTLRTGFLMGQTNEQIMREFGPLGPGRKGWAMTEAVVRTGMAEASQAAHDAFFDANEDLLPKVPGGYRWEWDATNDTRLCELCAPLDGLRFKTRAEMPPKPHWGCRCKKLPITATEAQLRADGEQQEGSFLERREVKYVMKRDKNGKPYMGIEDAPAGWRPVKEGGTAYSRPQKQDGKKYWVRRVDMAKGKTLAGDMLVKMNQDSKHAVLGNWKLVERFDILTKPGGRYANNPQGAVRLLLSGSAAPPTGAAGPMKAAGRRRRR